MHVAGDAVILEEALRRSDNAVAFCSLIDHGDVSNENRIVPARDIFGKLRQLDRGTRSCLHRRFVGTAGIAAGETHAEEFGLPGGLVIVFENCLSSRRDPHEAAGEKSLGWLCFPPGRTDLKLLPKVFSEGLLSRFEVIERDTASVTAIEYRDGHSHQGPVFEVDDHFLNRDRAPQQAWFHFEVREVLSLENGARAVSGEPLEVGIKRPAAFFELFLKIIRSEEVGTG